MKQKGKLKLHLGCGKRHLPGYFHMDRNNLPHLDYCGEIHDLHMFEDESVDEIYNCGVIGYYDREEIIQLLREWNRVLKKEGTLRISVVDFEKQIEVYLQFNKNLETRGVLGPIYGRWLYRDQEGRKRTAYKKTSYDFNSLKKVVTTAGFKQFVRYNWKDFLPAGYDDYSAAYIPHKDESGIHLMLNVECKKWKN